MRKFSLALMILILPVTLSGCWYSTNNTFGAIDPPPIEDALVKTKMVQATQNEQSNTVQVYLLNDAGFLVPCTTQVSGGNLPLQIMNNLVKGEQLPKGFVKLFPKGTEVKGVKISEGKATIDLSSDFEKYDAALEGKILDAITWSLTGLAEIKEVNLSVNGKLLEVMPKGKLSAMNMTRKRGINLEVAQGVNPSQSMPVVLYFTWQAPDQQTYHVPITRMVNESTNVAQATLCELIRGPELYSKLINNVDSNTELNTVEIANGVVKADFNEQLTQYDGQKAISQGAFDAIMLSLTENTGVSKVKITVNGTGKVPVLGQENAKDQLVSRPKYINAKAV